MHVGPTGGGKCVDVDFDQVYTDERTLYGDTGNGGMFSGPFMCP